MNSRPQWTFLTNHAHVLILLHREPDTRMRDIAARVGITERAVARIVSELVQEGYVAIHKDGRRNHYVVHSEGHMRHPVEAEATVDDLLAFASGSSAGSTPQAGRRSG